MIEIPDNLLLAALSPASSELILSKAQHVTLESRHMLVEQDETPRDAWFITSGIASVVVALPNGGSAEVVIIGHEGMVGGLAVIGPAPVPARCFMQVAGSAWRLPFVEMRRIFLQSEEVRSRILEMVQQQSLTIAQVAACNKLHDAEARLARWLLMVSERVQSDTLHLTQEFVAQMLGTQRTTVALVAGSLQRSGLITYSRGRVKIHSQEDLESAACDCYPVTRRLFSNLYRQTSANVGY